MKPPRRTPEEAYEILLKNYRDLNLAVQMIREAVEECMEPGDLPSSEQFETTVHECEAIAFAVARLGQRRRAKSNQVTPREKLSLLLLEKKPRAPSVRRMSRATASQRCDRRA